MLNSRITTSFTLNCMEYNHPTVSSWTAKPLKKGSFPASTETTQNRITSKTLDLTLCMHLRSIQPTNLYGFSSPNSLKPYHGCQRRRDEHGEEYMKAAKQAGKMLIVLKRFKIPFTEVRIIEHHRLRRGPRPSSPPPSSPRTCP
jgi:hypothetical protein